MDRLTRDQIEALILAHEDEPAHERPVVTNRNFIEICRQSLSQEAVRDEALEEAAEAVNHLALYGPPEYSLAFCQAVEAIRALKREPNAAGPASVDENVCKRCKGSGDVKVMTQSHGPDDYETDIPCPDCNGTGVVGAFGPAKPAPESETPEVEEYERRLDRWYPSGFDRETNEWLSWPELARSLERRLSLAQTEIKGHVRREEDLKVRIAELEETRAVLKSQMDDWLAENHKTLAARDNAAARADQAQSRIAELEKDAARYRWLRDNPYKKSARMLDELVPEELDAAIDAALKDRV